MTGNITFANYILCGPMYLVFDMYQVSLVDCGFIFTELDFTHLIYIFFSGNYRIQIKKRQFLQEAHVVTSQKMAFSQSSNRVSSIYLALPVTLWP
jgi:hypothetical protein